MRPRALAEDQHGPARNGAGSADAAAPVVVLQDVAADRAGRRLWSGLTLPVAAGEFVGVLGPNGVGKSTLINIVLGMLPPAAGDIRVLGQQPGAANDRIGYLPQRRSFDPALPIRGRDIVRLGLDGTRWGVPLPRWGRWHRAAAARVDAAIELVGASGFAHRPIGQLSGGEQQRLLIAQALAPRPELLLLDEPLDSLDLANQAAIAALVSRICRAQQVAVLIVAHDVNPLLPYVDKVVYLAPGGTEVGPPGEVITSAILTRLFHAPIEVLQASDGRLVVVGQPEPPAIHTDRHSGAAR